MISETHTVDSNFRTINIYKRNMHYAQQIIVKQATRAKAVLDADLRKHKNMPVDMIFLLFDTLVRPILLFNCEIWGIKISKELELFHLKFLKSILGVKTTTNTCLVYIETGRYPLYITIYKLIIKYWLKLIVTPKHRYIYVVSKKSVNCWFLFVKKLLFQYGLDMFGKRKLLSLTTNCSLKSLN